MRKGGMMMILCKRGSGVMAGKEYFFYMRWGFADA